MTDEDEKRILAAVLAAIEVREKAKADAEAKSQRWTAQNITLLLGIISAIVTSLGGLAVGLLNNDKNERMLVGQHAAVAVAEDVKTKLDISTEKLDKTTEKQEKTLSKVQKATEAVEDSLGPQLWASYRYLRDVAVESNSPEAIAKAADAKKKYDEHVARQKVPKG